MEHEFDILIRRMEKNLEMRHTYLMFAFTTTVAAIAVLFAVDSDKVGYWVCMIPFAVIIPFQARISYSRLTHAKMEAYSAIYYPDNFKFLHMDMNELQGIMGKIITIIANFELTFLSLAVDFLFVSMKIRDKGATSLLDLDCWIMVIMTLVVFSLAIYTYDYCKFEQKFEVAYRGG